MHLLWNSSNKTGSCLTGSGGGSERHGLSDLCVRNTADSMIFQIDEHSSRITGQSVC